MSLLRTIVVSLVLGGLFAPGAAMAAAPKTVPLCSWYSPSRGDNFTTSNSAWCGAKGKRAPDYRRVGTVGRVFDPARPQPVGTVALRSWYSPSRGDNHLTTDPQWAGGPGDTMSPDYRFVRIEGYVYPEAVADSAPLVTLYSADRGDHFTTSSPQYTNVGTGTRSPDYRRRRVEGYVLPVTTKPKPTSWERSAFGLGTVQPSAKGRRPLLVILTQYSDVKFRAKHTKGYFDDLVFGPRPEGSMAGLFKDMSAGRFEFTKAGLIGPHTMTNDPATAIDESSYNCANHRKTPTVDTCPGAPWDWRNTLSRAVKWAGTDGGIDFDAYDANGDGRVDRGELTIVIIAAEPPVSRDAKKYPDVYPVAGAYRSFVEDCVRPRPGGVQVCTGATSLGEGVGFATLAHESAHSLSSTLADLYGSGSQRASLMGATMSNGVEDVLDRYHLDPWHKIRLGWADPQIVSMSSERAGGSERLEVPQGSGGKYRPILFYDPARGTDEYFLVEYRNGSASGQGPYDRETGSRGVAVWYVKTGAAKELIQIPVGPKRVGKSVWVLGAPNQARGATAYWNTAHGEVAVKWPDGKPSPLRLSVGDSHNASRSVLVTWRFGGKFVPRIDTLASGVPAKPQSKIVLRGDFGVRAAQTIVLAAGKRRYEVPVSFRGFGEVSGWMPGAIDAGVYSLRVTTNDGRFGTSNAVRFEVALSGPTSSTPGPVQVPTRLRRRARPR